MRTHIMYPMSVRSRVLFKPIRFTRLITTILAGVIFGAWLYFTPPGLLGKADAVGYAVCHRIAERSFFIGDRQTPLCARCTGMYLGTLVGLLAQLPAGRRGRLPGWKVTTILGLFLAGFALDGINSYIQFFPRVEGLYQPMNWLRLLTGNGLGLGMAAMIYPIFNQSIWTDWEDVAPFEPNKKFFLVIGTLCLLVPVVTTQNPFLVYPLSVATTATILVLLAMIYTVMLVLLMRKENTFLKWQDLLPYLAAGFGLAVLQVALMDAARFYLSGTWDGFNLKVFS